MRIKELILVAMFSVAVCLSQSVMAASLQESVKKDEPRLLKIFENLHKNPELAFMEFKTSALVA